MHTASSFDSVIIKIICMEYQLHFSKLHNASKRSAETCKHPQSSVKNLDDCPCPPTPPTPQRIYCSLTHLIEGRPDPPAGM